MKIRRLAGYGLAAAASAAAWLDRLLLPPCCVFCGTECRAGDASCCQGCSDDLPWIEAQCRGCALPFAGGMADRELCADCQQATPAFECACAPLYYAFPVDAAIKAMKFHRRLDYVPAFAAILGAALQSMPADIDAVLPVPLHRLRHIRRGFNQATELAVPLARASGLPVVGGVYRSRATPYQSGLSAAQRRRNLQSAFTVSTRPRARHILIIDDVITTGTTCRALAAALRRAGVAKASVLAVARAAGGAQAAAGPSE